MEIKDYFIGKNILITGVTGFLGKTLLEKLLWEVPEIKTVRLLVRPQKGPGKADQRAQNRLFTDLAHSEAFSRLRTRHSDFKDYMNRKLKVYACDFLKWDLGLSSKTRQAIFSDLDAIIHIAAQVSWDERFDYSIRVNALASARLIEYAKLAQTPPRFVHISSAYVHGQRSGKVAEVPFDPQKSIANELGKNIKFDLDDEIQKALSFAGEVEAKSHKRDLKPRFEKEAQSLAARMKIPAQDFAGLIEKRRQKYVRDILSNYGIGQARKHGWIDSYTFSKAIAEMLLVENQQNIPLAIIRPPGITSAVSEPIPGWVEGYHLVEPLIVGVGKGLIHAFPGHPDSVIDTIPVDYVVNLTLSACAMLDHNGSPQVYQIGTSHRNPINLGEINRIWRTYFEKNPLQNNKGRSIKPNKVVFYPDPEKFIRKLKWQGQIPLQIAEAFLSCFSFSTQVAPVKQINGWIIRNRKKIEKVTRFSDLYSAYTVNSWIFLTDNAYDLFSRMSGEDQLRFNFDVTQLDWEKFWTQTHIPGMRRFVIDESRL